MAMDGFVHVEHGMAWNGPGLDDVPLLFMERDRLEM